jgi:hypothetical protein
MISHYYDKAGKVIETHEHAGDFKEPRVFFLKLVAEMSDKIE